jgi:hypothetical protein
MTDPLRRGFKRQSVGDLLRRPTCLETINHSNTQGRTTHELAQVGAPATRNFMSRHRKVTRQILEFGDNKAVPVKFAENG